MEWVLSAAGAGAFLGWSLIEIISTATTSVAAEGRDVTYAALPGLGAFVGGMLLMWSFVLAERPWASTGLMIIGLLAGAFVAASCEALRFVAELNEVQR